ncbi:acyltransferase [Phenylobacterium sp.]|uniref:acyltransferase family protein n=1 Tax=Phenylobacterium sp. TaxID=1871053 RepID=UPI0027275CE3|nr:acyltransferase [Phenylobacterium sp.]MDO8801639.1 acyltransferase [Phenylobacterium sp.]
MLRGVCALLVVLNHIRAFVFVDFHECIQPGIAVYAFYFLTSLGHQAVIAFFALSGYLVGGRAFQSMIDGKWSSIDYAIARLSRLWTVVLPALIITFVLDKAGATLGGGAAYAGKYGVALASGPLLAAPADHSIATLLANLLFLQTITAPVYGSNGPLWSLANEFWYYVLFPIAASTVLLRKSLLYNIIAVIVVCVLLSSLPAELLMLGSIWCGAAAIAVVSRTEKFRKTIASSMYMTIATIATVVCIIVGSRNSAIWISIIAGLAWSFLLPALAVRRSKSNAYRQVAFGLSEISYTMYATHFPILAFLYFVLIAPTQFQPNLEGFLIVLVLTLVTLASSSVLWWSFERNSTTIRIAISSLLHRK